MTKVKGSNNVINGETISSILKEQGMEDSEANVWLMKKVLAGENLSKKGIKSKLTQDFGVSIKEFKQTLNGFKKREILYEEMSSKGISIKPHSKIIVNLMDR